MNATLQKLSENFGGGVLHDAPVIGAELARQDEDYESLSPVQKENNAAIYACAFLLTSLRKSGLLTSDDFSDGKLRDTLFALQGELGK